MSNKQFKIQGEHPPRLVVYRMTFMEPPFTLNSNCEGISNPLNLTGLVSLPKLESNDMAVALMSTGRNM